MRVHSSVHGLVALTVASCLITTPFVQALGTTPPAKPAAAATTTSPPPDGGWPKSYTTPTGAKLVLYQPQIASWDNREHMVAYSAVSYSAPNAEKAALGTVKFEADTAVAMDKRLVNFDEYKLTEMNFGSLGRDQTQEIGAQLQSTMPKGERVIALDRVLAGVDKSTIIPKNVEGVKADPPKIFYSAGPAVLVGFDGDPIWSPIKGNDLKYAINTNWDVFQDGPSKALYLRNGAFWLKADKVDGPWAPAGTLPASFSKLPADANWKEVKANLPGKKLDPKKAPKVFVSTAPAEMILTTGVPSYLLVQGTSDLLWVQNTDSDVFRVKRDGPVFYLVAGRWFSAPGFEGPWTFATPTLPAQFKEIPAEHPRSRVLASVPGTQQAAEAVLLAEVPQTARVNRKEVKAPEVKYQGDPQFEAIPQTSVARAVNTDKDIVKVGDIYYMLFQGVWFMSKAPVGPWEVASTVPKQIYEIPASSPAHNVTYVTVVEDKSNSDWVTFAAVAGYTGMMIAWGCAVWGTGWYYPPYVWHGGFYPVYYPYYRTYGAAAWYNPWTGTYGRSAVAYGPYGGVGATARYNPHTGTYARGAVAYGPYGARGVAQAYNPRTGTYAQTRQGSSVYGNWGSSYVQRGDDWAQTAHVTNRMTGTTTRAARTDEGAAISRRGPNGGGFVAGNGDNVYAGHDGNVYRRSDDGGWQKYDNGGWGETQHPSGQAGDRAAQTGATSTVGQLNRDRAARTEGATRTRDYGTYQRSGGASAGSYRSGGGARPAQRSGGAKRR